VDALAALLGKKTEPTEKAEPASAGPDPDLVQAVADFRNASTPKEAAEALLLALQLANEQGNSDL